MSEQLPAEIDCDSAGPRYALVMPVTPEVFEMLPNQLRRQWSRTQLRAGFSDNRDYENAVRWMSILVDRHNQADGTTEVPKVFLAEVPSNDGFDEEGTLPTPDQVWYFLKSLEWRVQRTFGQGVSWITRKGLHRWMPWSTEPSLYRRALSRLVATVVAEEGIAASVVWQCMAEWQPTPWQSDGEEGMPLTTDREKLEALAWGAGELMAVINSSGLSFMMHPTRQVPIHESPDYQIAQSVLSAIRPEFSMGCYQESADTRSQPHEGG